MKSNVVEPFECKDQIFKDRHFSSIFYISKVFGMFPFALRRGRLQVSVPWCVLSVVVTSWIALVSAYNVIDNCISSIVMYGAPNLMARPTLRWTTSCKSVFCITFVLSSFWRAGFYNRILQTLSEVDGLLQQVCSRKQDRSRLGLRQVLGGISCILIFVYNPWENLFTTIQNVYTDLLAVCLWLSAEQFAALGRLVDHRIAAACERLTDLGLNVHLRIIKTRELSIIHNKICDVCSLLDSVFSRLLTFQISVTFFGIITCAFMIYNGSIVHERSFIHYLLPGSRYKDVYISLLSSWICLYASCIWQITSCALEISKKVEMFNLRLYSIMIADDTEQMLQDDHLSLHIAMSREVTFTAGDLFKLDFTLVHSIIASTASYVVLLIQFGSPAGASGKTTPTSESTTFAS